MPVTSFKGESGKAYEFYMVRLDAALPTIGGVYMVTHAIPPHLAASRHKILYVGCTDNLFDLLQAHEKQECFSAHDANMVGIHIEDDEDTCSAVAQDLLAKHDPTCNT